TGKERGRYVQQDEHWEPPYLDTSAILEDLDTIAARMRPLLGPLLREGVAPDFHFIEALEQLDRDLGAGLPEWLEPADYDYLGHEVTSCLLEWEWSLAQENHLGAPAFIDSIRELDIRLHRVALDEETLKTFVLGLSEEHLRAILESITRQRSSARWADAFSRAYGAWPEILRELARRQTPSLHEELCRANLQQSWSLALPLIQGAVELKDWDDALSLIHAAIRSMLRLEGEEPLWEPRESLLLHQGNYLEGPNAASLLQLWQRAARAKSLEELDAALTLQLVAWRGAEEGDAMLEAFRAIPPRFRQVRDALFADWRTFLMERTFDVWRGSQEVPWSGWVPALVNAALEGPRRASEFHDAVRAVLEEASTTITSGRMRFQYEAPLRSLALLTQDLLATAPTSKRSAPRLFKLLASEARDEDRAVDAVRRKWCARLGGASLLPLVLAFWRDHGIKFVPDPGPATGNYAKHADWLAAIQELNPGAAAERLGQWAEAYPLKRNLWRDLAQRGFSIPPRTKARRPRE
ncbi:MAG TPA: hypothetical protein VLQ93_22995, partial [Myxococcaceae bacterium]|nr:hypothetical protein [Myxococcaceae bacterium]